MVVSYAVLTDQLAERSFSRTNHIVTGILATPPGSPTDGQRVLVAASGTTGVFVGQENKVAVYAGGAWQFLTPVEGWTVYNQTSKVELRYGGASWATLSNNARNIATAESLGLVYDDPTAGTSNRNKIQAYIDSEGPNGAGLLIGKGILYITGDVTINQNFFYLAGHGPVASTLMQTSATASGLIVQPSDPDGASQINGVTLENITVTHSAGNTDANECAIRWRRVTNGSMKSVRWSNYSRGLLIQGGQTNNYSDLNGVGNPLQPDQAASYVLRVESATITAGTDFLYVHSFTNVVLGAGSAQYGLDIGFADSLNFTNLYVNKASVENIRINPNNTYVYGLNITNCYVDAGATDISPKGIYVGTTGTGRIANLTFTGLQVYNCTQKGIEIGDGDIESIHFESAFVNQCKVGLESAAAVRVTGELTFRDNVQDYVFNGRGGSLEGVKFFNYTTPVTSVGDEDVALRDVAFRKDATFPAAGTYWQYVIGGLSYADVTASVQIASGTTGWAVNSVFAIAYDGTDYEINRVRNRSIGDFSDARIARKLGASNVAVAAGGSGYSVGDFLVVLAGSITTGADSLRVKVTAVDGGGAVTAVELNRQGIYDTMNASPVATSGGGGTGCTISFTSEPILAFAVDTTTGSSELVDITLSGEIYA